MSEVVPEYRAKLMSGWLVFSISLFQLSSTELLLTLDKVVVLAPGGKKEVNETRSKRRCVDLFSSLLVRVPGKTSRWSNDGVNQKR